MAEDKNEQRYKAFISYSHKDKEWGNWLHKSLETYKVPAKLIKNSSDQRDIPKRIFPVFKDTDELPADSNLGANIENALKKSDTLIVICSPAAAKSRWVNQEILTYKRNGGEGRILAILVGGEPGASDAGDIESECFPEALRFKIGVDGELTSDRVEPIAADLRRNGDGKGDGLLKVIAGVLGVRFDDLKERDRLRRRARRIQYAVFGVIALSIFGAGIIYSRNKIETERDVASLNKSEALVEKGEAALRDKDATLAVQLSAQALEGVTELNNMTYQRADDLLYRAMLGLRQLDESATETVQVDWINGPVPEFSGLSKKAVDPVYAAKIPGGDWYVVGENGGWIGIKNSVTGEELPLGKGSYGGDFFYHKAVSPDGKIAAALYYPDFDGNGKSYIIVFNLKTRKEVAMIEDKNQFDSDFVIKFDPSGRYVVTAGKESKGLRLWDMKGVKGPTFAAYLSTPRVVYGFRLGKDKIQATLADFKQLQNGSVETVPRGSVEWAYQPPLEIVNDYHTARKCHHGEDGLSLKFINGGYGAAPYHCGPAISFEKRRWRLENGFDASNIHADSSSVQVSNDGRRVLFVPLDKSGATLYAAPSDYRFSPKGVDTSTTFIRGGNANSLTLESFKLQIPNDERGIREINFTADGSGVLAITEAGNIFSWSEKDNFGSASETKASVQIRSIFSIPQSSNFVGIGQDSRPYLISIGGSDSLKPLSEFEPFSKGDWLKSPYHYKRDAVWQLSRVATANGKIAVCMQNGVIGIWDGSSGALLHKIETKSDEIFDLYFSPKGKSLAVLMQMPTGYKGNVALLDIETGRFVSGPFYEDDLNLKPIFSPKGDYLVWAANEEIVKLTASGQVSELDFPYDQPVAFQPGTDRLLAYQEIGTFSVIDMKTEQKIQEWSVAKDDWFRQQNGQAEKFIYPFTFYRKVAEGIGFSGRTDWLISIDAAQMYEVYPVLPPWRELLRVAKQRVYDSAQKF